MRAMSLVTVIKPMSMIQLQLLSCMLLIVPCATREVAGDDQAPSLTPELDVREFGSLDVGHRRLRLWASIRNDSRPANQWQFRYDPLFLPEVTKEGRINFSEPSPHSAGGWQVSFTMQLSRPDVNTLALKSVRTIHPTVAKEISTENVFARPVLWLRATPGAQFSQEFPNTRLARTHWNLSRPAASILLTLISKTKEEAIAITQNADRFDLELEYALVGATTMQNAIDITSKAIANSELFARLNGLGSSDVYIRRFDARQLLDNMSADLLGQVILENPKAFTDELLKQLLVKHSERIFASQSNFDAQKWQSTYHGADLQPDKLTHSLSKFYSYDKNTMRWVASGNLDTAAKLSYLNVFGAEGSLKASYSTDEFKEMLAQRNIEVDLTGDIVVPKSIEVFRINLGSLKSEFHTSIKYIEVTPPSVSRFTETVDVAGIAKEAWIAIAQGNASLAQDELVISNTLCGEARTVFGSTKRLNTDGKKLGDDAAKEYQLAQDLSREAVAEVARGAYAEALKKFREARQTLDNSRALYVRATSKIEPLHIVTVNVKIETTHDDKDKEIYFTLSVRNKAGVPIGSSDTGTGGVEWPDSKGHVAEVSIPARFPFSEQAGYYLAMTYHNSAGGNHGWEGKITSVTGVDDEGKVHELHRGATGDFKLGENNNPKEQPVLFDRGS